MKKYIIVLFTALASFGPLWAEDDNSDTSEQIFVKIQQKAEYPGGIKALNQFLSENVVYPEAALTNSIQGTVIVKFVINKDGSTEDVQVAKSVHPLLDAEAVRVVSLLKGWKPAVNDDRAVRCRMALPVRFVIN